MINFPFRICPGIKLRTKLVYLGYLFGAGVFRGFFLGTTTSLRRIAFRFVVLPIKSPLGFNIRRVLPVMLVPGFLYPIRVFVPVFLLLLTNTMPALG
tara:strand:+ start:1841 stop:2131 length:291 start_codon:yes stop_codon:yes gene_type:complete